jgi:hypothetical protein
LFDNNDVVLASSQQFDIVLDALDMILPAMPNEPA